MTRAGIGLERAVYSPEMRLIVMSTTLAERAQQECDQYGKDAVLNREERAYSYTRYHYRCETRKADQVNE